MTKQNSNSHLHQSKPNPAKFTQSSQNENLKQNSDVKEQILNLKRPDKLTAKYMIEAELDDLIALINKYALQKAKQELKSILDQHTENTKPMSSISDEHANQLAVLRLEERISELERQLHKEE